jgi:signal transduction histidine kinase
MQTIPRGRPLLIYGAVLALLASAVFFIPGIGPSLLRTNGYSPHGVCILWQPELLWFHVTNDVLIGGSYVAIAGSLAYLVFRSRRDLPFHWVLLAFGAFIISCGSTHFMEAWTFWTPLYWLSGYTKLITAIASVATAVALPPLIPRILGLLDAARVSNERKRQLEAANGELAQLNDRLTELDTLKSQLFANVSHELRTPLTLILGPVERLLATAPADQRRDLETIRRNAQLLQRHVDDLLDVARLEAGRLELRRTRVDLSQIVRLTADYFAATTEARQMSLQLDLPPVQDIQADADQLQRVLINLVGNAVKFTPDGGVVRVSLRVIGDEVLLEVEDSGPGVPESQREAIFERFRQVEGGATRRFGGTGLGLAIARELVTLHGGTIQVATSPLGGARFTVTLPVGHPETLPASEPSQPPRLGEAEAPGRSTAPALAPVPAAVELDGQPHVLVVEDNVEVRQFLAETLAAEYRVTTAADGAEGVRQALDLRPDLIVSDVMMPGVSGDQLVTELRRHAELEQTPIVMLTARADADLRLQILRGGAQDYLLKPFSAAELLARLHNLSVTQRARRTLQRTLENQETNLATLSAQVARLYAEAQAALRLRDEFIAIAAHELRTPVTALLGNTQLLVRRAERTGGFAERDGRAVRAIGELGERIAGMVERLLDLARIEQEQLTLALERLDLAALVARTGEQLGPILAEHTLAIELPPGPLPVHGDAERLTQVFANLLTNAARYSAAGTTITLGVRQAGGRAEIAIRDQGIGIPAEALPRLFERFYRGPNSSVAHTGGLGLGLYLSREIVRRHGGDITAASVEGQGSTFTVTLPLAEQGTDGGA